MTVAYVMEQGASIRLEGERLVVQKKKNTYHTLHIYRLPQLVLYGNISLTPPVIAKLLREGIDTVFMSRGGRYQGRLQRLFSKNISLRCEQFARMNAIEFCLNVAKSIIVRKLSNMRSLLMRIKRNRDDPALAKGIEKIKSIAKRTREAEDLESLRGFEGAGSSAYFSGFAKGFIGEGVCFEKRNRRPPTDFVVQFERKMNQKIKHGLTGQQLSYRDCIREQVRHFARVVRGEDQNYRPMAVR